jgi:hypothetical protein
MLEWSISASACRSDSNRATTCSLSIPHRISFTATRRRFARISPARREVPNGSPYRQAGR